MSVLHGVVVVDVDRRDPGAAFFSGTHRMRHHIDLGIHRVGAPDHDQIRDAHLARIDARHLAGAGGKSHARDGRADRRIEARVFFHVREPVDAVAHHEPHGAGIVIGPDRLGAEVALGGVKAPRDLVERVIPADPRELARPLGTDAEHRIGQPVRMVDALGVARDLGADDARGIGLLLGATHPPDAGVIDHLDIEPAGRWAIMRAGRMPDIDLAARGRSLDFGVLVHGLA
jgi:hypothetical protein